MRLPRPDKSGLATTNRESVELFEFVEFVEFVKRDGDSLRFIETRGD
jgi:hypothetical protein